jgi:adenosylhomocysteine nucleosidase
LNSAAVSVLLILASLARVQADTAILVALPSELDGVRKAVRLAGQPVELAQHKVSIGYRKGEKIYIVRTGAGIINATSAMQSLVTRYKIDRVISIGVSGNLNDDWKIGDILVANDVVSHQQGKETAAGFEPSEHMPTRHVLSADYRRACDKLRKTALEVTAEILRSAQNDNDGKEPNAASQTQTAIIREGRLVSGDSFIASTAKRQWLRETFKADAVDMVSYGIAGVCEANGVPYVVIRVLSDNANESASSDFAAFINTPREPLDARIAVRLLDQIAPKAQ